MSNFLKEEKKKNFPQVGDSVSIKGQIVRDIGVGFEVKLANGELIVVGYGEVRKEWN